MNIQKDEKNLKNGSTSWVFKEANENYFERPTTQIIAHADDME